MELNKIHTGNNLEVMKTLPDNSIDLIVASPNYNNWRNKRTQALEWIFKTNAKYRQRITWDRCGMQAYNPVRFYRVDEDIYILGKESKGFKWNTESAKYLSVWRIVPNKNIYGHNATFPEEIVKRCVEAFTNEGDVVFDPYSGTGTTCLVAKQMNRNYIGIDVSEKYNQIAETRLNEKLF